MKSGFQDRYAMNAGEAGPQILELPGEPTLWRTTDLPPRRIELPSFGRHPRWRLLLILLICGPLVCAAWAVVILTVVRAGANLDQDLPDVIKLLLPFVIFLPLLVSGSEAVFMTLRGLLHRGDHARLDAETFWHFQLCDPVAFRDIRTFEVFYLAIPRGFEFPAALRITMDRPVRLRFASAFNRRRRSPWGAGTVQFTFSAGIMANDPVLLIDAIAHLVKAHGGDVVRRRNFAVLSLAFS
jgi:hypothetical protein